MLDENYQRLTDKEKIRYWEEMAPYFEKQGEQLNRYKRKARKFKHDAEYFEGLLFRYCDQRTASYLTQKKGKR